MTQHNHFSEEATTFSVSFLCVMNKILRNTGSYWARKSGTKKKISICKQRNLRLFVTFLFFFHIFIIINACYAISTLVIFSHFPMSEIRKLDFIAVTARACIENCPTDGVLASNRKFSLAISNPMTKVNSCRVYVTYTHFPQFPPSYTIEKTTKLLKAEGIISLKVIDRVYVGFSPSQFWDQAWIIPSKISCRISIQVWL